MYIAGKKEKRKKKADAEDSVERAVETESGESYESQKGEVGIAKGPVCKADVCEVHDAWQPPVSSEPVLRGNEKGQRWDDVPQHTEYKGHMHLAESRVQTKPSEQPSQTSALAAQAAQTLADALAIRKTLRSRKRRGRVQNRASGARATCRARKA